jgi:predicted transcriptional regulator
MKVENIAVSTRIMRHGMTVYDFFEEALRCNVPGLPYADDEGRITGRISIRNIYKSLAVPDNVLRVAEMMGDMTESLDPPEIKVAEIMAAPVEDYLLERMPTVTSHSSVVKALAIMEIYNSGYIFLMDYGEYKGVVTRMDLARRMLQCYKELQGKKSNKL